MYDWDMLRHEFQLLDQQDNRLETDKETSCQSKGATRNKGVNSWINKFLNLPFKLVDTYRVALHCFPSLERHNLPFLANTFSIRAEECQTVTYRWKSRHSSAQEEKWSEICVEEKCTPLQGHNAIADVLITEKVFKLCLEKLMVSVREIAESYPQFLIDKSLVIQVENYIDKAISEEELFHLGELAKTYMNVRFPCKGSVLKDMKKYDIHRVISGSFMSKPNPSFVDKRNALIYKSVMYSPPKTKRTEELQSPPLNFDSTARGSEMKRKLHFEEEKDGEAVNENTTTRLPDSVASDAPSNIRNLTGVHEIRRKLPFDQEAGEVDDKAANENIVAKFPDIINRSSCGSPSKQIKIDDSTTGTLLPAEKRGSNVESGENPPVESCKSKVPEVKMKRNLSEEVTCRGEETQYNKIVNQNAVSLPVTCSSASTSSEEAKMEDIPGKSLEKNLQEFQDLLSQSADSLQQILSQIPHGSNTEMLSSTETEQKRKQDNRKGQPQGRCKEIFTEVKQDEKGSHLQSCSGLESEVVKDYQKEVEGFPGDEKKERKNFDHQGHVFEGDSCDKKISDETSHLTSNNAVDISGHAQYDHLRGSVNCSRVTTKQAEHSTYNNENINICCQTGEDSNDYQGETLSYQCDSPDSLITDTNVVQSLDSVTPCSTVEVEGTIAVNQRGRCSTENLNVDSNLTQDQTETADDIRLCQNSEEFPVVIVTDAQTPSKEEHKETLELLLSPSY